MKNKKIIIIFSISIIISLGLIFKSETLYLFDLEVDDNFKPRCLDGEVEKFELMEWKKVLKLMQNTNSIKNNCNLVFFNFMVRHGLINKKLEKNYEEILRV